MTKMYEEAYKLYLRAYSDHENKWSLCAPVGLSHWNAINIGVGIASGSDTMILDHLRSLHYDEQAIIDSGLCCAQPDGSVRDAIQNSLVFPMWSLQGGLAALFSYNLSTAQWKQIVCPGSDTFLSFSRDKQAGFLILCETLEQCLKIGACGILNAIAGPGTAVCDTPEDAAFWQSVDGPVILFSHDPKWMENTKGVLETYGIDVYKACDYLSQQQITAIEDVDDEEFGDYFAVGTVFLWCNPETTQINIPEGIEVISPGAFIGCDDIEKIVIPQGVKNLNVKLWHADSLKELHIPASVKEINPFILGRNTKCTVYTTKGSAAEQFAKTVHSRLVIKVRLK